MTTRIVPVSDQLVKELPPLLKIRNYTPSDAPALIALINDICAEGMWFITDHYIPTVQWENALHHSTDFLNHLILLADHGGRIIGWCQAFPVVFGDKSPHVLELGIGVAKEWRNQGAGTALIHKVIQWAEQQAFEKIILSSFLTNTRALHVFEKAGFVRTGTRYKQYKVQGEYVDEVLMERFL
jgi:RimJ/RimL family protein N-acetyltransferase